MTFEHAPSHRCTDRQDPPGDACLSAGRANARQPDGWLLAIFCALFLVAAVCVAPGTDAAETYYRWKDERGKLVVSDRPPTDVSIEYEVVSQRSSLVRRVQPGEGAVPPETTPRPGNEFEQVDASRDEADAVPKNPETCARAQANLETLETAARIRIRDPDTGELRYLSEEEKDIERRKARENIRIHCE